MSKCMKPADSAPEVDPTPKRMKPADRKASILEAALYVAEEMGYTKFRLVDVAARAECSTGLVMSYWPTMARVRRDVMRAAVKRELLHIIAVGIALGEPSCGKLSHDLRARALGTLQG